MAVCGIDAETIRDGRTDYATAKAKSIIFWGMGVSQHIHGTDNARCLIALALITGQVGRRAQACIRCAARTTCRARPTPG
jgi:formate dehydrogenase major subunit